MRSLFAAPTALRAIRRVDPEGELIRRLPWCLNVAKGEGFQARMTCPRCGASSWRVSDAIPRRPSTRDPWHFPTCVSELDVSPRRSEFFGKKLGTGFYDNWWQTETGHS